MMMMMMNDTVLLLLLHHYAKKHANRRAKAKQFYTPWLGWPAVPISHRFTFTFAFANSPATFHFKPRVEAPRFLFFPTKRVAFIFCSLAFRNENGERHSFAAKRSDGRQGSANGPPDDSWRLERSGRKPRSKSGWRFEKVRKVVFYWYVFIPKSSKICCKFNNLYYKVTTLWFRRILNGFFIHLAVNFRHIN